MNEKLYHFFNNLKFAAKVNLAFGFILKHKEDGGFRYENKTLLEACVHNNNLTKLKGIFKKLDVIGHNRQSHFRRKYKTVLLDKLSFFQVLFHFWHGNQNLKGETLKTFNSFLSTMGGVSPSQFQRVHKNGIPLDEDLFSLKVLHNDNDIVKKNTMSELARRSARKH